MKVGQRLLVFLQAVWLPLLVCIVLTCSAVHLAPRLLHRHCEMTYMYSRPQYRQLNLSLEVQRSFPQYSLHYYYEGRNIDTLPLKLSGIPALFIPGNAGSHKQGVSSPAHFIFSPAHFTSS